MSAAARLRAWLSALLRPGGSGTRRVNVPSVLQMEALECGAASLAMVLAYYRKFIPLEELRATCGVSRNGSTAGNIVKAARIYGLTAKGYRAEPAGLRKVALPMIVFWNFNHFLVVEGFGKDRVYLNDPAGGKRVVSEADFDKSFTGVVIGFAPGEQFIPSGRPPRLLDSLTRRLVGARRDICYLVLVGLALVVPGMVVPVFTAVFIDNVLIAGMDGWMLPLALGMLATALLTGALTWLQRHYLMRLEMRIAIATSARFLWHVLHLPVNFYHQRSAGDIGARVGINDEVAKILSADLAGGLLSVVTSLFFAIVMAFYDVAMTLVTLAVVAVNIAALRFISGQRKALNRKLSIERGKVIGTSMGGLMLIETLKASGSETEFFSQWAGYQARLMNSMQEIARSSVFFDLLPSFLTTVNATLILGIGGLRVIDGDMTVGMLVAFQALVASFITPVNSLVALGGKLQSFQGDMDRLDDVTGNPVDPGIAASADAQTLTCAKLEGTLELRNVTFGYGRLDPPLIENFSLLLKPGQRVALVGASGCGKSTVSKLVMGLYAPWEGQILFDGAAREAIPRQVLLNTLAIVDQDISMFSGTIRENLTMWDATVPHTVVVDAAKDAAIHDIISSRPGGYDSVVSEGGGNFSGGQRQRLEIARALTLNPRLLVLDEATSALDPLTEKIVDNNLRRRGCGCLVVAHRLSAIRDCDEIIFLQRGKIVERGTHEQLMLLDGHYAKLIATE